MGTVNLRNLDDLRQACDDARESVRGKDWSEAWGSELGDFLRYVEAADLETRSTVEFQRKLWDDNPVSATGQGNVPVDAAIEDDGFRRWLASASLESLPATGEPRTVALKKLYDELEERVGKFTTRNPRLKIYRALAGLFPRDFTTISHHRKLSRLRMALLGMRADVGPARHRNVLNRLAEALGPAGDEIEAVVERMRLPWLLYSQFVAPSDDSPTEKAEERPGTERLVPLPAARRRRGLTGVSGGLPSILAILEPCREGISRDDLKDEIRAVNPSLKESSITTSINVLMSEFNCLKRNGDQYTLTDRGESFLDTGDPNELMDWLITQILGVDHVLVWLRESGQIPQSDLVSQVQRVNPGWTTNFAPSLLVNWLRFLDILERDRTGNVSLTESGREWAARIDWAPESLPELEGDASDPSDAVVQESASNLAVELPPVAEVFQSIQAAGHFSAEVLQRLHNGLWLDQRRHFAVLTGLSGSGKTLLAKAYGEALAGKDDISRQMRIIPVQPGWYDPTSLLGYVNPLQSESYVRSAFLEFLLRANADAARPYTVVLDEMNLSRPEQYLAPLLSAMETGAPIQLHSEGGTLDGIPSRISYPANLVIIGTVNMDETTHGLSDKVLDRAFVIDFWDIDLEHYPKWGSREIDGQHEQKARRLLTDLMEALRPARLHFGWRTVDDVLNYLERAALSVEGASPQIALDEIVYAKILPKLRGDDSARFRTALERCADALSLHGLEQSRAKVLELRDDLQTTGSARFWR